MSFDLYFVVPPAGGDWSSVLEGADSGPEVLDVARLAAWERIVPEVTEMLGGVELFGDDSFRELSHVETGIELSMYPAEIALTVPYWYDGEGAAGIDQMLRDVAVIVERETGLVAYDPQTEAPFLGVAPEQVVEAFGVARVALGDAIAAATIPDDLDDPAAPKRRFFRRR